MRKVIALLTGLVALATANYAVYDRERLLTEGRVVLLRLGPVDPRSLMQGDYMALTFEVAGRAFGAGGDDLRKAGFDGRIILKLDGKQVGTFTRFDDGSPLSENEARMRYRIRNGRPKFATNAFFFQEGDAKLYADAGYGEFRVGGDGEAILIGLRDREARPVGRRLQK